MSLDNLSNLHSGSDRPPHPRSVDTPNKKLDIARSTFSQEVHPGPSRTDQTREKENALRLELSSYASQAPVTSSNHAEKAFNPDFPKHLQQAHADVTDAEKALKIASSADRKIKETTLKVAQEHLTKIEAHAAKYYPDLIPPTPPQTGVFPHDTAWTTMHLSAIKAH